MNKIVIKNDLIDLSDKYEDLIKFKDIKPFQLFKCRDKVYLKISYNTAYDMSSENKVEDFIDEDIVELYVGDIILDGFKFLKYRLPSN